MDDWLANAETEHPEVLQAAAEAFYEVARLPAIAIPLLVMEQDKEKKRKFIHDGIRQIYEQMLAEHKEE